MTAEDEKPGILLDEATDWLLRLQDAPHDAELALAFDAWIARSDAHRAAWERANRAWRLMGEVPPVYEHVWNAGDASPRGMKGEAGNVTRLDASPPRSRRLWRGTFAAGALAACLVAFLAYPSVLLRIRADYITPVGGSRSVTLADGTLVDLGADTALKADITPEGRRVELLAGEAFFDVSHDAARPFVVEAGGARIAVLGTAFNVRLTEDAANVELARGAVDVSYAMAAGSEITLAPGQMAVVDLNTGTMEKSEIAPDEIAAWRSGRLFVNDASIASVVEQIRRYHGAWISVPDGDLSSQKVTGLYDLHDPDRALRALVQPYGGRVLEVSPYVRILSRY